MQTNSFIFKENLKIILNSIVENSWKNECNTLNNDSENSQIKNNSQGFEKYSEKMDLIKEVEEENSIE